MSRLFKFRAFESGKMYYQVRCGGVFEDIPTAPNVWNEDAGDWLNLTGQPHTVVMQYAGLKDKNDREIYEGDIVKVKWRKDEDVGVVKYLINSFCICEMERYSPTNLGLFGLEYEVIGNIYERREGNEV